tara:strand:- start:30885 stop:31130 length:246 start_codon:yes stop_codon:yes gene_type:complete
VYGWCPNVRGLTKGEVELGLMARLSKMRAINCLDYFQGVACLFNPEALASLGEHAGMSDKDLIKLKMNNMKNEMKDMKSWQ